MRNALAISVVVTGVLSCAPPDLQTFEVTFQTVRDCHPAGIFPELCEDPRSFVGRTRQARVHVEMRGPNDFILYEENGRALPGYIDRNFYFARYQFEERTAGGCARIFERSVKFSIQRAPVVNLPNQPPQIDRLIGNLQDRSSRSPECGQATSSRYEEKFEGDAIELGEASPFVLPTPGGGP